MADKNSEVTKAANKRAKFQEAIRRIQQWQKIGDGNEFLSLGELDLTELPKEIVELKNLQRLDLSYNQLSELPNEIVELTNLQWLYLDNNQLSELPKEIVELKKLQRLYLTHNRLSELPKEIGGLKSLQWLYLSYNQLSELPNEIDELKSLQRLYLTHNRLSELPKEIVELTNLQWLYLSHNQLSELPKEIGGLKNLQCLYLSGLAIRKLPKEIGQLENLTWLELVDTSISDFPKEFENLKNLKSLNLKNTHITNLPYEIKDKADNAQAIINYYFENIYQVNEDDVRPLKEVKVLLVGQGRVGKTSLVRYLVDNKQCNPEEPSTHGIHRNKLKINVIEEKTNQPQDVQLNIWDFGGQDIQHQTHQFFLNQRSLYLLVLDAGRDEAGNKLDYWLKKIETVGKDAPVLVAINKSEQCLLPLDFTELKKNFNIKGFFNISCETGRGIDELRRTISDEIGKIENVFEPIRKEWFEVKEHLESLKEDYISRAEYRKICHEKGVTETLSQDTLLILLHELGIMLNFKEHDTEVLNPEWVTRGVYQVVTSLDVQTNKGILTPDLLEAEITKLKEQLILEKKEYLRYPREKYSYITDLMKKFELAYQIDDTDNYFVPSLLPKDSPYVGDWNEKECLGFRYNYENGLLHETIMSRFIVRMNRYILDKTQWLTGVLLKNEHGNKALVKADLSNSYLTILIDGFHNTRREFLGIIRDKFNDIHKENRPIEEVPLKDFPNAFVKYELLLGLEKEGIEQSHEIVDGKIIKYNVKELLNSVSSLNVRKIEQETDTDKFGKRENLKENKHYDAAFSYAGEDREFVQSVYEELKKEGVSIFYDGDEEVGDYLWGKNLIEELDDVYRNRSKCVIIFVSENYAKKVWTKLESRSALANALNEQREYVLPARFDETNLPGLLPTVAFVDLRNEAAEKFARRIIRKIGKL